MKINLSGLLTTVVAALKSKKVIADISAGVVVIGASFGLHLTTATVVGILTLVSVVAATLEKKSAAPSAKK